MTDIAIVKQQDTAVARPRERSLNELLEMGDVLVQSGLAPATIKTKQQAAIIMLKGQELGLKPMQAMSDIYVVHGQASLGTKLMAALYKAAGHRYEIKVRTADTARVLFMLADGTRYEHTMTMAEVNDAKWNQDWDKQSNSWKVKHTWKAMQPTMLMYRCLSSGIRLVAPEVLHGMAVYDPKSQEIVSEATEDAGDPFADEDVIDGVATVIEDEPEQEPEPEPHWAKSRDNLGRLMQMMERTGITQGDVITALAADCGVKVERLLDYPGTFEQAMEAVAAYIEKQAA